MRVHGTTEETQDRKASLRFAVWTTYSIGALLLLNLDDLALWSVFTVAGALVLASFPALRPPVSPKIDRRDLVMIGTVYVVVVSSFWVAFVVFTTDNVLGLFLAFAFGLVAGVAGPVVYQVWIRRRDLASLGLGTHRLRRTALAGVVLAGVQFSTTLWGYDLPAPVDWVPLLVMSMVVGFFEAVFFRGFVQGRLEASLGPTAGVGGAAVLYSLYHVGYGMGVEELWFLFGLGVVYAIVFRLTTNILVLWPLLTPLGAFFNNLEAADIPLPWESILGFADVAAVMAVVLWLAHRRIRRGATDSPERSRAEVPA